MVTEQQENNIKESLNILNLIVLLLSAYVLITLIISSIFRLSPEVSRVLDIIDSSSGCIFKFLLI